MIRLLGDALSWIRSAPREDRLRAIQPDFVPVTGHPGSIPRIDAAGWLSPVIAQRWPSVRHSRLTSHTPIAIVWHYTACRPGTKLWTRIQGYDPKRDRAASWHVIIEADGTLYQSVPFVRGAWHCARGSVEGHRMNACSVGIELASVDGSAWPEEQIERAGFLLEALVEEYGIKQEHAAYGHADLDPERRADPGSIWMHGVLPALLHSVYRAVA